MNVKCVVGCQIGDDVYEAGKTYSITKARFDKYASRFTAVKAAPKKRAK